MTSASDWVGALLAAALGAGLGIITTFTHRQYPVEGIPVVGTLPLGLLGGYALVAALVAGFRLAFPGRRVAGGAVLGVLAAVGVLALPSPGGGVLVAGDATGTAWVIGVAVIAVVALAWPEARRPAP